MKDTPIPRISARRYPAGVDRRFDEIKHASDEFIRLARRGHVFGATAVTIREGIDNEKRRGRAPSEPCA